MRATFPKVISGQFIWSLFFLLFIFHLTNLNAQEKKEKESKPFKLPVISIAEGMMNFSGDFGYNKLNEPLYAHSGFQIEIQNQTEKKISFALFFLSGQMLGEEKTISRALNFKSSINSGGLMFRYDFINRKRPDQILVPYITAGVEYIMFKSHSDLLDQNGKAYQYWDDGTIKDIAQTDSAADQAIPIYRDYNYETDLSKANLDGKGTFKTNTWGFPVGAGVRFRISDRCSMHFSSVCHFTGTDYIDGVTADGTGERKGNSMNDKFFYSSVSFRFALSSPNEGYSNVDFNALANEDADGDGIPDILDDSSGTPLNNKVDVEGKPYDADNDGIPDYRDQEPNSASDAVVNEEGVTITEEMIEAKFRKDSLAALPAVIEYLKSYDKLAQRNPDVEKKWLAKNSKASSSSKNNPIPPLYRSLDGDHNGIITPKEISLAIDDYLAKRSTYTISEFFDLIDFFFTQK